MSLLKPNFHQSEYLRFVKTIFNFIETFFSSHSNELILMVAFKDQEFTPLRRHRLFIFIDFVSYVGGLLGLFAGISVLSFFEILYFFIPRFLKDVFENINRVDALS